MPIRGKQRRKSSLSEVSNSSTGVLARGLEEKRTCGERHQKTGRQTSIVCGYFLVISKYFWYIYLNQCIYLHNTHDLNIYIYFNGKTEVNLKICYNGNRIEIYNQTQKHRMPHIVKPIRCGLNVANFIQGLKEVLASNRRRKINYSLTSIIICP